MKTIKKQTVKMILTCSIVLFATQMSFAQISSTTVSPVETVIVVTPEATIQIEDKCPWCLRSLDDPKCCQKNSDVDLFQMNLDGNIEPMDPMSLIDDFENLGFDDSEKVENYNEPYSNIKSNSISKTKSTKIIKSKASSKHGTQPQ